jgi:hypothetical protein
VRHPPRRSGFLFPKWDATTTRGQVTLQLYMALLPLIATLLFSLHDGSASRGYTISVVTPEQADAPVRIVGIEGSRNHSAQIIVQNFSRKKVVGAYLDSFLQVPEGCPGSHGVLRASSDSRAYRLSAPILPDKQLKLNNEPLVPAAMLTIASDRAESSYLQVQVAVVEVEFADGTKWEAHPKAGEMFDPSLSTAESAACKDAPPPAPFRGVRYKKREELNQGGQSCGSIGPKLEEAKLGFRLVCSVNNGLACCPDY